MTQQIHLKKPTGVLILACLFLIAPFGNLLISFAGSGVKDWYNPSVMFGFVSTVSMLDWCWLSLLFITGLFLLRPHKTSWSLAIITLLVVLGINTYRAYSGTLGRSGDFVKWQLGISFVVTLVVLVIAFYFRFPYLDRRAQWLFPTAHRFEIKTPADVVAQEIFEGVTESLSHSGARILLKRHLEGAAQDLNFVDIIFPAIRNLKIKARIIEYDSNVLRVKFKDMSSRDRAFLSDWIKSQNKT
jgi:hypothetical protein